MTTLVGSNPRLVTGDKCFMDPNTGVWYEKIRHELNGIRLKRLDSDFEIMVPSYIFKMLRCG